MSNVDRSDAMARLEKVFAESKENNEGAGIPEIVEAVLTTTPMRRLRN